MVPRVLEELLAEKGHPVPGAGAHDDGMPQSAQALWASAAALEERIAPLLDACGEDLEAAVHRISAASCYEKAGDPSRATNLYRAALAGPLRDVTRKEVEQMLSACLARLKASPPGKRAGKVASAS
jgi:hypothetical protein